MRQRRSRRRHYVSPWVIGCLRPLMRYSNGRQAYVLRGVGTWVGPVLRYRQLDVASEGAVTAQSNDVPAEARVRAPGQESDG